MTKHTYFDFYQNGIYTLDWIHLSFNGGAEDLDRKGGCSIVIDQIVGDKDRETIQESGQIPPKSG